MLVNAASATTASLLPETAPTGTVNELSGWITSPSSSQSPLWMCDGRGGDAS